MQPDRFAEYDDFLYAFLASALKEEKEYREARYEDEREEERRLPPDALSPVQQAFQDLSEFLRVIDEPEKSQDYDPLGLSLERLERHTSGLLLREKTNEFIERLADELVGRKDESVVLLPVDDVDMSPEHLVKTLKTYQSYLLHPRLVPVFTFTDRTAEETLRVYFKGHLSTPVASTLDDRPEALVFQEAGEGTQQLPVSEQLALQYLSRCFPVRTRVRLGPAPARLREARYRHRVIERGSDDRREDGRGDECRQREQPPWGGESDDYSVNELLEAANHALFGCPDRNCQHELRTVLRPSTLRRQLHVVDEIVAARMELFMSTWRKNHQDEGETPHWDPRFCRFGMRWVDIFHRAVWSLMNVHRDVLREFNLFLEDLYSWTPQGLRRVVLDTLLQQDLEFRRALLRRWQFRTDSRRGQTVSLLAANAFRPWMPGEEPYGDVSYARQYDADELRRTPEGGSHISAMTATLWFLRLSIGFYLPQVLAENRPTDIAARRSDRGRIVGIGWDLRSGPVNAVMAAETENNHMATGIVFTDPRSTAGALRVEGWLGRWEDLWVARRLAWEAAEEARENKKKSSPYIAIEEQIEKYERCHDQIMQAAERLRSTETEGKVDADELKRECESLGEAYEVIYADRGAKGLSADRFEIEAHGILAVEALGLKEKQLGKGPGPEEEEQLSVLIRRTGKDFAKPSRSAVDIDVAKRRIYRRAKEGAFLLRCWSFYGYSRGRYWAATSFWRGLGLIGHLLEARRKNRMKIVELQNEEQLCERSLEPRDRERLADLDRRLSRLKQKWPETVRGLLRTHLLRGMVPGELLGRIEGDDRLDLAFERWDMLDEQLRIEKEKSEDEKNFLQRVLDWLKGLDDLDEQDALDLQLSLVPGADGGAYPEQRWSRSLMRRLHGDDIVGDLMVRMNAAYIERQGEYGLRGFEEKSGRPVARRYRWNAGIAMVSWTRMLLEYWRGIYPIQRLLRTCPLLAPFVNGPMLDDLRHEIVRLTPGSVMTIDSRAWEDLDLDWKPKGTGGKKRDLKEHVGFGIRALGHARTSLKIILRDRFTSEDPSLGESGSAVTAEELGIYLRWLGLVEASGEQLESWVDIEKVAELMTMQYRGVLRNAPALHLFHRVPRVLHRDFRPLTRT